MDLGGKVYPPSSKHHLFIIVSTNYFTKLVEARAMKTVNQVDMIKFIKEDIIHRFGIPKTITADHGTVFTDEAVETFTKEYRIKLTHSTPYFSHANGQTEATNKILKGILEKMQHNLTPAEYSQAMMQETKELDEVRLAALDHLQIQKKVVARAYNKRVRFKDFGEGDLVWKTILPIGFKDPKYGKWSPAWEGPFTVTKILGKEAYQLQGYKAFQPDQ
nr:uncharacterized protein LOC125422926 [Ziziphus jujuba var. spinosa]